MSQSRKGEGAREGKLGEEGMGKGGQCRPVLYGYKLCAY